MLCRRAMVGIKFNSVGLALPLKSVSCSSE